MDMQTIVKHNQDNDDTFVRFIFTAFFSKVWLLYFLISIAILGGVFAYGICVPLYLIGRFYRPSRHLAEHIFCRLVQLLMDIQPWFNATLELDIPVNKSSQKIVLISNHRSHLDSFILLSRVRGIRIFAKKSLFYIPFLGFMMRLTRQVPGKRGQVDSFLEAMEVVRQGLRDKDTIHLFPEMTRCPEGYVGTQKFSTLPFQVAIQEKATLIPIVFQGSDHVWAKGKMGVRFRKPMRVSSLAPIDCSQFSSAHALKQEVKRMIDNELLRDSP
jgi:1-acyl-sn-glycerol-3-phosphate acyltransferase